MKKIQITLFIISTILSISAFTTVLQVVPNNYLSWQALPILIYLTGILINGILFLSSKLNRLIILLSTLLLLVTIFTWIKFPEIGIIYTPFIAYFCLCLLIVVLH